MVAYGAILQGIINSYLVLLNLHIINLFRIILSSYDKMLHFEMPHCPFNLGDGSPHFRIK